MYQTVGLGRLRVGCAQTAGISCAWAKWLRAETLESDLLMQFRLHYLLVVFTLSKLFNLSMVLWFLHL